MVGEKTWVPVSPSAAELELLQRLKRALDPKGPPNRGKVIGVYPDRNEVSTTK